MLAEAGGEWEVEWAYLLAPVEVVGVGKVWSETRLNRRLVTTRMSVATFSGAS